MTDPTLERDYHRSLSSGSHLLVCPACETPLLLESTACPACDDERRERGRIVSFLPDDEPIELGGLGERDLETLATYAEGRPLRTAVDAFLDDPQTALDPRPALFDVGRDAWRTLVGDRIEGRCLDLYAGTGRRSMLLAELADVVYAVDPSLPALQIVTTRDDFESAERVVPIHTTADRLPFAEATFDTVVADLTGLGPSHVRAHLATLGSCLDDSGSLFAVVDGWPRRTGLTDRLGLTGRDDGSSPVPFPKTSASPRSDPAPTLFAGVRAACAEGGLDHDATYALFPTATRPLYVFDVENEHAVNELSSIVFDERTGLAKHAKALFPLAHRAGLLKRSYPSYLLTMSGPDVDPSPPYDDPLLVSGRARSVVLELPEGTLARVSKVPNRQSHASLSERENAMVDHLRSSGGPLASTLPSGTAMETPFGSARRERPVEGRPLASAIEPDPDAFDRILRIGYDWLIDFQRARRTDPVVRSPDEVVEDLRFEPTDLEPPSIDNSVETFYTPVHGDFNAANVRVDGDAVTGVIDWEYGSMDASPIIDAGFLLLDTAAQTLGDFEDGIRTVCCENNPYAERANARVRDYCDAVDISTRTFVTYLPAVFVHRLELDWRIDAVSTYTNRITDRSNAAQFLFDLRPSISFE